MLWRIEFALTGPIVAGQPFAHHQINASIHTPPIRPFRPEPYRIEQIGILRIGRQIVRDQPLKKVAFFTVVAGGFSEFVENILEGVDHRVIVTFYEYRFSQSSARE